MFVSFAYWCRSGFCTKEARVIKQFKCTFPLANGDARRRTSDFDAQEIFEITKVLNFELSVNGDSNI